MIRNIKIALCIVFCMIYWSSYAQSDYRPGYIINNSNDTIYGFLNYRADILNSKKCLFVKELGGEVKDYLPGEIREYRFADSKNYITKTIEVNKEPKTIFIEFLLNGIIDLYYFEDHLGNHYYIDNKGQLVELTNPEGIVYKQESSRTGDMTRTYMVNSNKHIGLLRYLFADQKSLLNKINRVELNRGSLIKITKEYHNLTCKDYDCIVYEKPKSKFSIKVALLYADNYTKFILYEPRVLFDGAHDHSFGMLLSIRNSGGYEKLSFDFETRVGKREFHGNRYEEHLAGDDIVYNFDLKQSYINSTILLKYTYPKRLIRPLLFTGLSIGYNFNSDLQTNYLEDLPDYLKPKFIYDFYFGVVAGVGTQFSILKKPTYINLQFTSSFSHDATKRTRHQGNSLGITLGFFIN